jgi:hypothetical protein
MAKLLTFIEAQHKFESIITTDITVEDAIQEAVDRIYEFGRYPGTTIEIELTTDMFEENSNGYQILSLDDELYNGAVGFRTLSGGYGIVSQESLYRDGVNAGDNEFIDLESIEIEVEGVVGRYRQYRAPLGFTPSSGGPYYALMKLEPPELAPDDYVPIESLNALKMAIQAICYENVGDDGRASEHWAKFEVSMTRSTRQTDGPKKRRFGIESSLRRKPKQFM